MERRQANDSASVNTIPFLHECINNSATTRTTKLTKFSMNPGNVHRIGMNQSVSDKLPKLPAKNVYASH